LQLNAGVALAVAVGVGRQNWTEIKQNFY